MVDKHEALNKAKESGKEIIKGGKEFGKGTVKVISGTWRALLNLFKGGYHLVNAGDKALGERITEVRRKKGEKEISKIRKICRNNIGKILIAGSLLGYTGTEAIQHYKDKSDGPNKEIKNQANVRHDSADTLLISTQGYDVLKNKPITTNAPLTRWYLGGDLENSGPLIIGDTLVLNPAESLHNLWEKKIKKYGRKTIQQLDTIDVSHMDPEDIESFRAKYPVDATYLFVVKPYIDGKESRETMDIQEFIKQTNKIVAEVRGLTNDYDGGLKGYKKELFDVIRNNITGESIVAYAMTELCENKENGEFNKQLFDLLLKNSGANYLAKIPAMYDQYTSYGLYQFTQFALYNHGGEKRGASIVNTKLPDDKKLPGSVIDLDTRQEQTKAAYMFAIQNLNTAVKGLTDQQAKQLLDYQKTNKENFNENITALIAMCHHIPAASSLLGKRCTDGCKDKIYNYDHKYKKHIKDYGIASMGNYEAVTKK